MYWAFYYGNLEVVRLLIDAGAVLDIQADVSTRLDYVAHQHALKNFSNVLHVISTHDTFNTQEFNTDSNRDARTLRFLNAFENTNNNIPTHTQTLTQQIGINKCRLQNPNNDVSIKESNNFKHFNILPNELIQYLT